MSPVQPHSPAGSNNQLHRGEEGIMKKGYKKNGGGWNDKTKTKKRLRHIGGERIEKSRSMEKKHNSEKGEIESWKERKENEKVKLRF